MSFFSKTRIKATELFFDAFQYLQRQYDQAGEVFTPASPFGQILTVVANLGELILFYIEAVATELNISRARNIESIYGLSRLCFLEVNNLYYIYIYYLLQYVHL